MVDYENERKSGYVFRGIFQKGFPTGGHACDTLRLHVCMVRTSP